MSKKIKSLILLSVACTALYAQKDSSSQQLDEVVVTATKTAQKQSTTGKVVTVINKADLEKSQGKTLGQILNDQVGLVINGAFQTIGSVQSVYTRGAGSGQTLILVDGVPVNDPSDVNNNFDLNFIALDNIERIEICRGAQSTIYGSDAIGGVINIITNKAGTNKAVNAHISVATGSYGTNKIAASLFGKLNKFSYEAGYSGLRTDGYSSAYDSSGKANFVNNGYKGNAYHANVLFQATQHLSFKGFVKYSQYKAFLDDGAFQDDKYYYTNNNNLIAGTGFQFKNNTITLVGNYQFSQTNRDYHRDSIDKAVATYYIESPYFSKSQFAELYASIKLGGGFTLLGGGDYRYSSMNSQYTSVGVWGPYSSISNDTSVKQSSLYTSLLFNHQKFNVELGGRLNSNSKYGTNYTFTFNPSYTINEHYRVFGSIASGFKAPSLYQLYAGVNTPYPIGYPNLQPEKSINYEIGLQQKDRNISNRIVLFYRDIKDGIDYNNNTYQYFNFDKETVKGIEYEISFQPIKHLSVTANYTFIAGTEQTESRISFNDTSYNYLLRTPKHKININVGYQFTKALFVNISGKYVSNTYDVGGYATSDVVLNNYFIVHAYAEYKFNKTIKLFADLQNIGNVKFFELYGFNSTPRYFMGGILIKL